MRILLTNDDGIHAPGIIALYNALTDGAGEFPGPLAGPEGASPHCVTFPVAPLTVQSATGHGVTFKEPLMTREVEVTARMRGVAVDGRPADCVKLALSSLWAERFGHGSRPDLLVSGMNSGANVGINVIYSGTVAAALEAAFLGVPSIAVSLHVGALEPLYGVAARHARAAIEAILAGGLPRAHECININIPVTEHDAPTPPLRVCAMNTHGLIDSYVRRVSPSGEPYYWATGHGLDFHGTDAGSDVHALRERFITVTPLHYDLTLHPALGAWRERLASA